MSKTIYLPPAISLLAATSRLLDLHQSRRGETGAYTTSVLEGSAKNIGIALLVLNILRSIELDKGFGFVSVEEITSGTVSAG